MSRKNLCEQSCSENIKILQFFSVREHVLPPIKIIIPCVKIIRRIIHHSICLLRSENSKKSFIISFAVHNRDDDIIGKFTDIFTVNCHDSVRLKDFSKQFTIQSHSGYNSPSFIICQYDAKLTRRNLNVM